MSIRSNFTGSIIYLKQVSQIPPKKEQFERFL